MDNQTHLVTLSRYFHPFRFILSFSLGKPFKVFSFVKSDVQKNPEYLQKFSKVNFRARSIVQFISSYNACRLQPIRSKLHAVGHFEKHIIPLF